MSNNKIYKEIIAKQKIVDDAITKLDSYQKFNDADEKVVDQLLKDLKVVSREINELQALVGSVRTAVGVHYNDLRKSRGRSSATGKKIEPVVLE